MQLFYSADINTATLTTPTAAAENIRINISWLSATARPSATIATAPAATTTTTTAATAATTTSTTASSTPLYQPFVSTDSIKFPFLD